MTFYPYILREVSILTESSLGHLCYVITDVPPQPNSQSDSVLYYWFIAHSVVYRDKWHTIKAGLFKSRNDRVTYTHVCIMCQISHYVCDYNDNTISQPNQQVVVFHDRYITHVKCVLYCLLRSSPCWLDDNNRLESSSKGSSCPAVAGWYTCEDYHTWRVTRSNRPYAIRKKYTRVTRE